MRSSPREPNLRFRGNDNIPVRIAVEDEATYAIIAAAANPSGSTVSNKLELTPKKNETPTPGTTEVAFKTGQLLYLPNGMLMINLYESENTEIYQTQIKIEGLENNGALQNNSRLLTEGMYKTLSPAYLIDMQGDSDIDDNLPAGSMVKIERGTEGKVLLTVSGTLSKSETKFKGTFTGTLENEVELKGYSINDISFDETGGAKWDAEAGYHSDSAAQFGSPRTGSALSGILLRNGESASEQLPDCLNRRGRDRLSGQSLSSGRPPVC